MCALILPFERARLAETPIIVESSVAFPAGLASRFLSKLADADDLITELIIQYRDAKYESDMTHLFPGE